MTSALCACKSRNKRREGKIRRCGNESKRNEAAAVDFKEMSKALQ